MDNLYFIIFLIIIAVLLGKLLLDRGDFFFLQIEPLQNYKTGRVHILHPRKTGGLSLRNAVGCNCKYGDKGCDKTTQKGRFICHRHGVTCRDIPKNEPYVMLVRDPIKRAISCINYKGKHLSHKKAKIRPLTNYINCPDNQPNLTLRTSYLNSDYQKFKKMFCNKGECLDSIPKNEHSYINRDKKLTLNKKDLKILKINFKNDFKNFSNC